jgi:site-specific DNA-adenine methylase
MSNKKLGIPYMGGKRQLSKKIIDFILDENPNCKYFYDLFGGGGAMSFEVLQRPQIKQVFYNDFDPALPALINKIRTDGITEEFYKWVSREEFHELKGGTDWRAGLIKTCWSFGNNGRCYIFGKTIEEPRHLLHEVIVNRDLYAAQQFELLKDIEIGEELLVGDTINKRRLAVMSHVKKSQRFDLEQLERLERLERLEQLEQLERLNITSVCYSKVEITTPIDETVIYLDPPYINTGKYQNNICHDTFYEWVNKSPYKIYLSSYESHLRPVFEINHRSTFSSDNSKKVVEKLFTNQ